MADIAMIDTLKATNSNGDAVVVYPRTKAKAITDDSGNNLSSILSSTESDVKSIKDTLGFVRKNILENVATSQTIDGITFTVNSDGSVTMNGTATADAKLTLQDTRYLSPSISDYISIGDEVTITGNTTNSRLIFYMNDNWGNILTEGNTSLTLTRSDETRLQVILCVMNGTTVSNETAYPMIRYSSVSDSTYEQYIGSVNVRLNELMNKAQAKTILIPEAQYSLKECIVDLPNIFGDEKGYALCTIDGFTDFDAFKTYFGETISFGTVEIAYHSAWNLTVTIKPFTSSWREDHILTFTGNYNISSLTDEEFYALFKVIPWKNDVVKANTLGNYDCNTLYDTGVYSITDGTNQPSGCSPFGQLLVMAYRKPYGNTIQDFTVQIYLPNGDDGAKSNSMFYRTSLGNSWNSWQEVATTSNATILTSLWSGTLEELVQSITSCPSGSTFRFKDINNILGFGSNQWMSFDAFYQNIYGEGVTNGINMTLVVSLSGGTNIPYIIHLDGTYADGISLKAKNQLATVKDLLLGFAERLSSQTWGNQLGTFITGFGDSNGCVAFRRDNPETGKVSMILDGTVYVNEGNDAVATTNTTLPMTTISTATDFNTLTTTGIYLIRVGSCGNNPTSSWGTLYVDYGGTPFQIFIPDGDTATIYKRKYSSGWGSWIAGEFVQKKTSSSLTSTNHGTNGGYVPTMDFLSFWNGAYSSNNNSNLAYCNKGAFGNMAIKSATLSGTTLTITG